MMLFSFWKNRAFPIGVDIGSEYIKMSQLSHDGKTLSVLGGAKEQRPADVAPGSSQWQHWAIKVIKEMHSQGTFKGRKVITALPAEEVFIDQIKIARVPEAQIRNAVLEKVGSRLPFSAADAMVQYVVTNPNAEPDVLVMATERTKVERHLAIFERANMEVQSVMVWPYAMISAYTHFFGRRRSDLESTVMLLEVGAHSAKVVICRHEHLLLARQVTIGISELTNEEMIKRLVLEISACARCFESTVRGVQMQRLIFLTGQGMDKNLCDNVAALAQHLQVAAHVGDVLAAVEVGGDKKRNVERRGCQVNWTASFGLSLSSKGA